MFLANSLKEKIKRNYLEGDTDTMGNAKYRYEPPAKDPRVLSSFKETMKGNLNDEGASWNYSSQQLKALDKKEWENTFTLNKLRSKWTGQMNLDFENNFKKFSNDAIYPRAFPAKQYVKNLRDPDILELKKKRWNISTNHIESVRPELKKTLFEVENGLKDFKVVPIKEHNVEVGVDSRDHLDVDGNIWNISNFIDKKDFKSKYNDDLTNAQENSIKYWKENEENREGEKPFPLTEDRKKIEVIRYFKKYRNPYQKSIDYYKTMEKVKELTFIERENAEREVRHRNPGQDKYPEKIQALVNKEMFETYKDKYNELIGKLSKEDLKKRQMEQNKFKWNDADLANKITAINKLNNSGILEKDNNKNSFTNRLCRSQKKAHRNLLLPLVVRGNEINKEEEKIREKLQEDFKKQQKIQLLMEAKTFKKKTVEEKIESKYPISKEEYEINKKFEASKAKDYSNGNEDELEKKINRFLYLSTTPNTKETTSLLNDISKSSDCGPHFLEAYSKIAGKEMEKINAIDKKNKENLTFKYTHPGTYREFTFFEKVPKKREPNPNIDPNDMPEELVNKKITEKFWSCCMNSDPNSRGCQRQAIKNFQYIYD